jgi:hypothetical protein
LTALGVSALNFNVRKRFKTLLCNFKLRRYTQVGGGGEPKAAKEAGKILARVQRDGGGGTAAAAAVTLGLEAELLASVGRCKVETLQLGGAS